MTEEFEKWWQEHGQFVRAGGGQYEVSFAYAAWKASRKQALVDAEKAAEAAYCECCFNENEVAAADEVVEAVRALQQQ